MPKESDLIRISRQTARRIHTALKTTNTEVIQPTRQFMNQGPRVSRRKALVAMAGTIVGTIAIDKGIESGLIPDPFQNIKLPDNPFDPPKKETEFVEISKPSLQTSLDRPKYIPRMTERIERSPASEPFDDPETNAIAREIGIEHAGKRFEINNKSLNKLNAIREAKILLPIFPEVVYKYKDLIYKASERYKVPPNIIALIITNKSLGYKDVIQDGTNVGLGQVPKDLVRQYTGTLDIATMQDPEVNIDVLSQHFKSIFEKTSEYIESNPNIFTPGLRDLDKDGSINYVYIKSLIAYSEGLDSLNKTFENLSSNARWSYENHLRFLQDAEITARLQNKGYDKGKIIQKLQSTENRARAHAFYRFRMRLLQNSNFIYDTAKYGNDILSFESIHEGLKAVKAKITNSTSGENIVYRRAAMNVANPESYLNDILKDYQGYFGKEQELVRTPPAITILNLYQYLNSTDGSTKIDGEENHFYYLSPVNQYYRNLNSIDLSSPKELKLYPNNAVLYNQLDPRWRDSTDRIWLDGKTSCGPTTFAMVLNRFGIRSDKVGNRFNPSTISKALQKFGLRESDGSTVVRDRLSTYDGIRWLDDQGIESIKLSENIDEQGKKESTLEEYKNYLDQGYLILASGRAAYLANADHIFIIYDVDPINKEFLVADPWEATIRRRRMGDYNTSFHYSFAVKRKS